MVKFDEKSKSAVISHPISANSVNLSAITRRSHLKAEVKSETSVFLLTVINVAKDVVEDVIFSPSGWLSDEPQ